jgi:AcrR family transcriptional regulator
MKKLWLPRLSGNPEVSPLQRFRIRCIHDHVYDVYQMRKTDTSISSSTAKAILEAARELLDRKGLAAVTMRSVAERVGVTPMAIYRHYADRTSLLNAMADEGFRELAARVLALELEGGVEHRLTQVSDVFVDSAMQFPNLYRLMFLEPREGARVYPDDFKAGRSPTFRPTVDILDEAMGRGELRKDDPIEIAFELSALSHGLIVLYLGGRVAQGEQNFRALFQRSFRRYLDGIRS